MNKDVPTDVTKPYKKWGITRRYSPAHPLAMGKWQMFLHGWIAIASGLVAVLSCGVFVTDWELRHAMHFALRATPHKRVKDSFKYEQPLQS